MIRRLAIVYVVFVMIALAVKADVPYEAYLVKKAICYTDADTKAKKLVSLPADQDVTVLEEVNQGKTLWLKVQYDSDNGLQEGYIISTYVASYTPITVYNATLSEGILTSLFGPRPIGHSANSIPINGTARVVYEGSGSYTGSFVNRKRSGKGTFIWETGDQYSGDWLDDEITGEGLLAYANGIQCKGAFKAGELLEGVVSYPQSDGRFLTREVKKGRFVQESVLYWPDGTRILGKIGNGKTSFSGKVTIEYASGDVYQGTLKDGLKSGKGTYSWTDGSHYTGNWEADMMQGKGTYYFQRDEKSDYITGNFIENLPAKSITFVHNGKKYRSVWDVDMCTDLYEK